MRNITVSVDDATYRRARIRAAELDTSVSALVREYLKGLSAGVLTERAGGNRRASHEDYLKRLDDLFADWDARGVGCECRTTCRGKSCMTAMLRERQPQGSGNAWARTEHDAFRRH